MSEIPPEAVDAAAATLSAVLEPWLPAQVHGTTLGSQIRMAAACALRDAEEVWPHNPPQRDPHSAASASTSFGSPRTRPVSQRTYKRFGFGPMDVSA